MHHSPLRITKREMKFRKRFELKNRKQCTHSHGIYFGIFTCILFIVTRRVPDQTKLQVFSVRVFVAHTIYFICYLEAITTSNVERQVSVTC